MPDESSDGQKKQFRRRPRRRPNNTQKPTDAPQA
jgi:hypothetical protein